MPLLPTENLDTRDRAVIRVFLITLVFNWAVAGAKIIVGILTGRLTIVADGLHSLFDGASNCLGIMAIFVAAKPPDEDHPYGHRKFENIAAMAIGGGIVLICWEILRGIVAAIRANLNGEAPEPKETSHVVLFATILVLAIVVNLAVSLYQYRRGVKHQSTLLKADARHTFSDCFVTLLSLGSLLLGGMAWWVDPFLALVVLVFLIMAAWSILRENLPAFTDRVQLDPGDVERVALSIDGVLGAEGIRSHGTPRDIHVDLTIRICGSQSAREAEEMEHLLKKKLRQSFPGITLIGVHHTTVIGATPDGRQKSPPRDPAL
ncbi:MAG: cation transporter [Candidatus Sumerlaeia bacterium]|nr:cation transporter [Candidatus Sumerlaeia bacterium]